MAPKTLTLTLPARVYAYYVIAAPDGPPPSAAVTELADALPEGVELDVSDLPRNHPSMTWALSVLSCPDCSPAQDPLVPLLIEAADGHLLVTCSAPPGWPPHHLSWGALATDRIAGLTGGIRLDPGVPRLLPDPWRPEPLTTPEAFKVSEWVTTAPGWGEESGRLEMHTVGLDAFGLPELRARGLEPGQAHGWWHLFVALSSMLVRRSFALDDRTLRLPIEPEVEIPGSPALGVVVRLEHDRRDGLLHVVAPQRYSGREAFWRGWVASVICGS